MTTRTSVPALDLIRSPTFGAFWLAQVASRFGDPITLIALAYVSYGRNPVGTCDGDGGRDGHGT